MRNFLQVLIDDRRPVFQRIQILALQRELVGGVAHAAADADVLRRGVEIVRAGKIGGLAANPRDDFLGGRLADAESLSTTNMCAEIGAAAIAAVRPTRRWTRYPDRQ